LISKPHFGRIDGGGSRKVYICVHFAWFPLDGGTATARVHNNAGPNSYETFRRLAVVPVGLPVI
jgi:hypothetical protein